MDFKIISLLYKNRKNTIFRNEGLINLIVIALRIKIGEMIGSIYVKQNLNYNHIKNLELFNIEIIKFDKLIRSTLIKNKIENKIDFVKTGIKNLGSGLVYIPSAFEKTTAFTQKEAEFYFKIDKNQNNILNIELISIPKISGKIKIENQTVSSFSIGTFETKNIKVKIDPNLIQTDISKIRILVDKCWNINHIYKLFPNFPLGVGIKSIELTNDC